MAYGLGRPLAALVLSDEERSWLEGQVRRRRIARSLSDRCRMILRCADGLGSKAVGDEPGGLGAEVDVLVEPLGDRHGLADPEAEPAERR